jgi:putative tryptophan/tyrosine transport system substrate-binding protein
MRLNGAVLAVALALAILLAPLSAEAQQAGKLARIGVLCLIPCEGPGVDAFRRALWDLGYVEARTLVFDYRDAQWKVERLPALAAELVQSKVDVIFTPWGTAPALAAKRATVTIPVVIGAVGDPVRAGIVPSLAKPGGNVTGVSSLALELEGKRLALLKELVPKVSRVRVFWDSENPYSALGIKEVEAAARALGVRLHAVRLSGPSDLDTALATLKRDQVEALVIHPYVATLQNRGPIIEFAAANRLPAIYPLREYVDEGGLLSYGANVADISRRAAYYVDRILKGAKPADLPVEQAMAVQLVVNLKTARALGLTIPSTLMVLADEVIQ